MSTFTELLNQRQRLVARAEALLEADRRIAEDCVREQQRIEEKLKTAGMLGRIALRRQYAVLAKRAAQAGAAYLVHKAEVEALMAQAEALDEPLTKLARAARRKGTTTC